MFDDLLRKERYDRRIDAVPLLEFVLANLVPPDLTADLTTTTMFRRAAKQQKKNK